jgi:hypothetical protein
MGSSGVRGLLVYCADHRCGQAVRISGDRRPDHIRLSDLEPLFVCTGLRLMMSDSQPKKMSVGVPMIGPAPTMRELVSVSTLETVCR